MLVLLPVQYVILPCMVGYAGTYKKEKKLSDTNYTVLIDDAKAAESTT